MDTSLFLPILSFFTLLAVAVFAYRSSVRAEARRKDPNARKSTLASDARSDGPPPDV